MSISTSFTTMFGRLPRAKEAQPIIGAPVLTQSTNEELSRRLGITIADFDELPLHPQALGVVVRRQSAETNRPSYDQTLPLPLVHPDKFDEDGSNMFTPSAHSANPYQYTPDRQPSPTNSANSGAQSVTSPWKTKVIRKPTPVSPANLGAGDTSFWGTRTTITAGHPRRQRRHGSVSDILLKATTGSSASPKPTGFALGYVVRDKVTGKRKASPAQKPQQALPELFPDPEFESEAPIITTKPPNLHCIDEWLDSRAGIHKRSSIVSTVPSTYIRNTDTLKLHIRQSTFEPLEAPGVFIAATDAPEMPPIPAKYLAGATSKPAAVPAAATTTTSSTTETTTSFSSPPPTAEAAPSSEEAAPSSEEAAPSSEKSAEPTDLISRLEHEQERLETRKRELRKEVYELEIVLPPNPCSLKLEVREQLKSRLEELHGEYADAEKAAHDTGLKLYRAYRRTDKKNGVDGPTHLWVSRVTG